MAIKMGHSFPMQHGFKGSANPGMNFRPTLPGYKGGGEAESHHAHHTAKEHLGKHNYVSHDGDHHMSHVHYDKHGFQHHKLGKMARKKKGGVMHGEPDGDECE